MEVDHFRPNIMEGECADASSTLLLLPSTVYDRLDVERELMQILEYTRWGNFELVVAKAKDACQNSGRIGQWESTIDC